VVIFQAEMSSFPSSNKERKSNTAMPNGWKKNAWKATAMGEKDGVRSMSKKNALRQSGISVKQALGSTSNRGGCGCRKCSREKAAWRADGVREMRAGNSTAIRFHESPINTSGK